MRGALKTEPTLGSDLRDYRGLWLTGSKPNSMFKTRTRPPSIPFLSTVQLVIMQVEYEQDTRMPPPSTTIRIIPNQGLQGGDDQSDEEEEEVEVENDQPGGESLDLIQAEDSLETKAEKGDQTTGVSYGETEGYDCVPDR